MEHIDEDAAENACGEGTNENGYLAGVPHELTHFLWILAEGKGIDENGHGETDTTEASHSEEHLPCRVGRHGAHFALDGDETGKGDANGLSKEQSEEHTHAHASEFRTVLEDVEVGELGDLYASVGQGEDGHDEVVDIRIEGVLESVTHTDGSFRHNAEAS